jgi:multidrug efflux pump subunit AcrA (membrane-fusion protein)
VGFDSDPPSSARRSATVTSSDPSSPVETASPRSALAIQVESAASFATTPREYLEAIAPLVREYFGAWLAVATMPHRDRLIAVDAIDEGSIVDAELLRLQMVRSGTSPSATTIRLANGRGARSLQVALGDGEAAVGLGIVHSPDRAPDGMVQLQQLRELVLASEAAYRAIHAIGIRDANPWETSLPTDRADSLSDMSRTRLREFHVSLDLVQTAMTVASESAWIVDCDRVCVLLRHGNKYRVTGVTGVDVIDRRGNQSACLEKLALAASVTGRPLHYPGTESLPPQIETPLNEYMDQSLVQSGVLIPVMSREEITHDEFSRDKPTKRASQAQPIAMISFERFRGEPLDRITPAMMTVCEEAVLALSNAKLHHQIFLRPLWQTLGRWLSPVRRHRTLTVAAIATSLLIASMVIQTDYKVTATGTIEPLAVRNLFAPSDGVVTRLLVNDGDMVSEGDVLAELENAELQRQSEEIAGEIHTVMEKLGAINASLVSGGASRGKSTDASEMSIERRHLETQLESLRAQQLVIRQEKERQTLRSPITGQVIGWRLQQRLDKRPVSRGHRLFAVADVDGPKTLRLQVPDRETAALLQHADANEQPLRVDFILATKPDQVWQAEVAEIASSTSVDSEGLNMLDVRADVKPDQSIAAKTGADVTAGVYCGRRSVLATWFGDIARFYHQHIRFHFTR